MNFVIRNRKLTVLYTVKCNQYHNNSVINLFLNRIVETKERLDYVIET